MSKSIFNIFFSILFVLFSFYYTNKIVNYLHDNDPIMIEIKKYEKKYTDTKIEPVINNLDITLGINGEKINVNKSYLNMKKTGKFDKNLLVFEQTKPTNKIDYNSFIVSLNKKQNDVSIVFILNDFNYINQILSILKNKNVNATFFITGELINNNINIVQSIIDNENDVELLSDSYTIYEVNKYNSILRNNTNDKLSFCINLRKDEELLKSCNTSKLYSIVPTINLNNGLYSYIVSNLDNGMILSLKNNKNIINELSSSINYIKQKGKKIILLKNIIE